MGKQGIKMNYLRKIFFIIPIALLYNIDILLTEEKSNSSIQDMLANILFESAKVGDIRAYVLIVEGMYFIFVFNFMFGTYIYHDFQVSSIYLFSRLKDRRKWFYKKVIEIVFFAFSYTVLFLTTLLMVCILCSNHQIDADAVFMLGPLLVFITLFLSATTLIINLLAIKYNSSVAFLSVYVTLLALVTILLKSDWLTLFVEAPYLLLLNPVSGIILNLMEDNTMKLASTIYYLILNIGIILLGGRFINLLEIGLLEKDIDG